MRLLKQRLVRRSPHLLYRDGFNFAQSASKRRLIDQHRRGPCTPEEGIERYLADRRQLDLTGPVQHQ